MPIGLILGSSSSIVLAFRGTQTKEELIAIDGDAFPSTPSWASSWYYGHKGFLWLYDQIRTEVLQLLSNTDFSGGKKFYLTGHSLGGGLATVCAVDLHVNYSATYPVPTVYTYGSPRVGTYIKFAQNFNADLGAKSYRVARPGDLITKVPILPFYHVNQLFSLEGSVPDGDWMKHAMKDYLVLLNPA